MAVSRFFTFFIFTGKDFFQNVENDLGLCYNKKVCCTDGR